MPARDAVPCPHCSQKLSVATSLSPEGGATIYWPPESWGHLLAHAPHVSELVASLEKEHGP